MTYMYEVNVAGKNGMIGSIRHFNNKEVAFKVANLYLGIGDANEVYKSNIDLVVDNNFEFDAMNRADVHVIETVLDENSCEFIPTRCASIKVIYEMNLQGICKVYEAESEYPHSISCLINEEGVILDESWLH